MKALKQQKPFVGYEQLIKIFFTPKIISETESLSPCLCAQYAP